ncbi:MAG: Ig-like domain-containing protein [Myxococcales bacterium]|nr:Ig-like domain-containing protein [Myxococcales bacterium]
MSLRTWTASLALAALAACGTVKGDDAPGDDMPDVDTTPPQLMTSTPGDAGTKVSLLAPFTFVFDEDLDASTVTDQAIQVTWVTNNFTGISALNLGYSMPVPGVVTFDAASRTITFDPTFPLNPNQRYVVRIADTIADAAGNKFAGKDLSFNTVTNQTVKRVGYNTSTSAVSYWQSYAIDNNGHQSRVVNFSGPGVDNIWLNSDDAASAHYEYVYAASGSLLEYRNYTAGADGVYNTGDDAISYFEKHVLDAMGRESEYSYTDAPGPDAMWGTADDPINGYQRYSYMPGKIRFMYFSGAGNDGMWRTPDDRVTSYQEYTVDARGLRTRYSTFNAGADQLPDTTDDRMTSYQDYEYDAKGNQTFTRRYNNAGPDMTWMTADDVTSYIQKWTIDANGFPASYSFYNAPGTDTIWNTADDVISSYYQYTYSAQGLVTSQTIFNGSGADRVWGTADDEVGYYHTYTYDQNGQRTDYKYYGAPGADNVWKTGDDRVAQDEDFDVAH